MEVIWHAHPKQNTEVVILVYCSVSLWEQKQRHQWLHCEQWLNVRRVLPRGRRESFSSSAVFTNPTLLVPSTLGVVGVVTVDSGAELWPVSLFMDWRLLNIDCSEFASSFIGERVRVSIFCFLLRPFLVRFFTPTSGWKGPSTTEHWFSNLAVRKVVHYR